MYLCRGDPIHSRSRAPCSRGRAAQLWKFLSRAQAEDRPGTGRMSPCAVALRPVGAAAGRPWPRGRRHLLGTAEGHSPAGKHPHRGCQGTSEGSPWSRNNQIPSAWEPGRPSSSLEERGNSEKPSMLFCVLYLCSLPLPHLVTWAFVPSSLVFLSPLRLGQTAQRGRRCFSSHGRRR